MEIVLISSRIIVLLRQCESQLERAQQSMNFSQQWNSLLASVQQSFEQYRRQLMNIRQEQTVLIHFDTIQVSLV